jgi:hypothetical protein
MFYDLFLVRKTLMPGKLHWNASTSTLRIQPSGRVTLIIGLIHNASHLCFMIQSALDPNQYALLKVFPNLLSEKIVFPNQLDSSSIWQSSRLIGTDTASCNEFLYVCARDWWTNNRTNTTSLPIIIQINSWPLITKSTHLLASFPNHIFFGTTTNWSQGFPTNCSRQ